RPHVPWLFHARAGRVSSPTGGDAPVTTTIEAIPQHMAALARGNELRMASAAIRREIRALPRAEALRRVADLLERPPMPIQRTRVVLLLRAVPRMGLRKTHMLLARVGCNEYRHVGPDVNWMWSRRALSERQRLALVAELRAMAERS